MHFFSSNSISSVIKHAHLPTEHNPQKIHHVNVLRTSYPQCSAYKTVRPAKTNTYCLVVVEWWVGALLLCTTLLKCSNVRKILTPLTAPSSALASNTDRPAAAPYLCPETQQQRSPLTALVRGQLSTVKPTNGDPGPSRLEENTGTLSLLDFQLSRVGVDNSPPKTIVFVSRVKGDLWWSFIA